MTKLTTLKNIGNALEEKLKSVDITSAEELRMVGSKEAFSKLKRQYPSDKAMSLVHLYALEGAVSDIEFNQLSEHVKADLKHHCESLKIFGS